MFEAAVKVLFFPINAECFSVIYKHDSSGYTVKLLPDAAFNMATYDACSTHIISF